MQERQGGSLFMKKLSIITRNAGRCTELKFKWLGWPEKSATSMYPRNPNWHLSSGSEASMVWAQRFKRCCSSFASGRSSVAPLWSSTRHQLTCWELWSHTLHGGTQIWSLCKWIHLQAWLWQNQQKADCPDRQHIDCSISWEIRNHLHGGSDSWDLYRWKTFQRSKQLPVAL